MRTPPPQQQPLTARQREAYDFICDSVRERGIAPTIREIQRRLGIGSPNGVVHHLEALEDKGYIVREGHMARGIRLVSGDERCPCCGRGFEGRASV